MKNIKIAEKNRTNVSLTQWTITLHLGSSNNICDMTRNHDTLGDIFKTLEMRRFFKEFAIFSDGQDFGFRNKILRIIVDVFLLIVTSSIHHLQDKLLIYNLSLGFTKAYQWIKG